MAGGVPQDAQPGGAAPREHDPVCHFERVLASLRVREQLVQLEALP